MPVDPFSVTVGAIALLETSNTVVSKLFNLYYAFKSAPEAMIEIADEMNMCATHVNAFSKSVDSFGSSPAGLQKDTTKLVKEVRLRIINPERKLNT